MTACRLKQANLVGPAGLISMEDSEAIELIQRAIVRDGRENSFLEFGGLHADLDQDRQGEATIRAFWRYYAGLMGRRHDRHDEPGLRCHPRAGVPLRPPAG